MRWWNKINRIRQEISPLVWYRRIWGWFKMKALWWRAIGISILLLIKTTIPRTAIIMKATSITSTKKELHQIRAFLEAKRQRKRNRIQIPNMILNQTVKMTTAQAIMMILNKKLRSSSKTFITIITRIMKFQSWMTISIGKYGKYTLMKRMTSSMFSWLE